MKAIKEDKFVKICPKCGSTSSSLTNLIQFAGNNLMSCNDCGYEGYFPEVKEKDIDKFKALLKKRIR